MKNRPISGAKKLITKAYDGTTIWRDERPEDIIANIMYDKNEVWRCMECEDIKIDDLRVKAGMKCFSCAYGSYGDSSEEPTEEQIRQAEENGEIGKPLETEVL